MRFHRADRERNIGVVGLGVGTLAVYGTADDRLRFYEINPDVIQIATDYFSFLQDTAAGTDIVPGDARLSLEQEAPREFDILVLDAFSGDAIPTHLLTVEALQIYLRHLKQDGLLCFHISNLHFDLRPVLLGLAHFQDLNAVCIQAARDEDRGTSLCHWVLLSRQAIPDQIISAAEKLDPLGDNRIRWSDEWSNLLSVLR